MQSQLFSSWGYDFVFPHFMWLVLCAHVINHTDLYDLFIISESIHMPKNDNTIFIWLYG